MIVRSRVSGEMRRTTAFGKQATAMCDTYDSDHGSYDSNYGSYDSNYETCDSNYGSCDSNYGSYESSDGAAFSNLVPSDSFL
jgi:hypothetical protein